MFWRNPTYGHLNYSFPHHRLCLGTNCQSHASWGLVSFGPWWSKYYLYSFVIWSFKVWSSGRWSVDIIRCVQVRWVGNTEEEGTTWATWGQVRGPPVGTVGCQEASGLSTCLVPPSPSRWMKMINLGVFHMTPYYRLNWKNSCKYHPTWTENITFCLILRPIFAHCHQISWSVAIFNKQGELVKTSLCSALIWWFFGLLGRCLYLIGAVGIYMKLPPGAH